MNRFQRWSERAMWPFESTSREAARTRPQPQQAADCSFFVPHHYEPNYAYPLLIWLHSEGDSERQLCRVMPHISTQNFVAAAPRAGVQAGDPQRAACWPQDEPGIVAAERRAFACLEMAEDRCRIDAGRVFIAGYQDGGTMALRLGLRHPEAFAGAISLGGPFPSGLAPLARLRLVRQLPLFLALGRESSSYPPQRTCDDLRLFHSAAMHVTLRQYPCADEMTTQMLADVNCWIMEQVTGVGESATSDVAAFPGEAN